MAEEVFRQTLAPGAVVGGDGFLAAVVDVKDGVFIRTIYATIRHDRALKRPPNKKPASPWVGGGL